MAKLYFHYSSMNAGKSALLLQAAHNYIECNMHPLLLKPILYDRENNNAITSRTGISKPAQSFTKTEDLFLIIKKKHEKQPINCVFIDEAQFLSKLQVWQLAQVVDDLNIPVMIYGLRTDFQGKLFPGSEQLLAIADILREICSINHVGKKATMILRLDKDGNVLKTGPQILIGENASYISVSRKEWRKEMD